MADELPPAEVMGAIAMTEAEWLACTDPEALVAFVACATSERKLRLLAAACCRHIWPLLTEPSSREAVEIAKGHADGRQRRAALVRASAVAHRAARTLCQRPGTEGGAAYAAWDAARATIKASVKTAIRRVVWTASYRPWVAGPGVSGLGVSSDDLHKQRLAVEALARDIFGNPFRAGRIDGSMASPTVGSLVRAAYDERALPVGHLDPQRLSVLSDALEEAGCADTVLLALLRSPGPHVRGCWALDLILDKT